MFNNTNKTLAKLATYVDTLAVSHSPDMLIDFNQKIDLLRTVLKESLYAYAIQYPNRVSQSFLKIIAESANTQQPKKHFLKLIKQTLSRKSSSENKEAYDLLEIIETDSYQDVFELQSAVENYLLNLSRKKSKKNHIGYFILNALETYYERIILPETFFQADFEKKKKTLITSVEKAIKRYNLFNYDEEAALIKTFVEAIDQLTDENNIDCFIKKPIDFITEYSRFPKKFQQIVNREFNVYQNRNVKFGEFYKKYDISFTIQDYIKYAIDKFNFENSKEIPHPLAINIRSIQSTLNNKNQMDQVVIKKVKQALAKNKTHALLQHKLKKYCKESIAAYLKSKRALLHNQKKQRKAGELLALPHKAGLLIEIPYSFTIKLLKPLDQLHTELNQFNKVLILLEGLRDHKKDLSTIAEEAREKGYLVVTYYLYGFEPTRRNLKLRLNINLLRRHFRKSIDHLSHIFNNASLSIYSNGLNSVIPLCEYNFLNNLDLIKSVLIETPAFSKIHTTPDHEHDLNSKPSNKDIQKTVTISLKQSKLRALCTIPILLHIMHKSRKALLQLSSYATCNTAWVLLGGYYDSPTSMNNLLELKKLLEVSQTPSALTVSLLSKPNNQPNNEYLIEEHARNILNLIQ